MRKIYKYPLSHASDYQVVSVPIRSEVRHFADQNGVLTMWLEGQDDVEVVDRRYIIVGTGWQIPSNGHWVGTCQSGPYVWHLYQLV